MTKYQLLKVLEPFDDEIEVDVDGIFNPKIYYGIKYDERKIVISDKKPKEGKWVELKV